MTSDNRDISVAGFLITADEWFELDPQTRAEIAAIAGSKLLPCPETASRAGSHVLPPEA